MSMIIRIIRVSHTVNVLSLQGCIILCVGFIIDGKKLHNHMESEKIVIWSPVS